MPGDLFGDLVSRPPSIRSRRAPLVAASIVAHTLVITAIIVVSLVATDVLPSPRQALAYYDSVPIADIPLPPPPPHRPMAAPEPSTPTVNPNAAPVVQPEGIRPESGIEGNTPTTPDIGVVFGSGSDLTASLRETMPPPPQATPPVRLHSGIQAPVKTVNVAPIYPAIAQAVHAQGIVIIETTIDAEGRVSDAKVLRSIALLDDAALAAVRQWRFTPALLNGVPIPVIMTVTVNFKLQ